MDMAAYIKKRKSKADGGVSNLLLQLEAKARSSKSILPIRTDKRKAGTSATCGGLALR